VDYEKHPRTHGAATNRKKKQNPRLLVLLLDKPNWRRDRKPLGPDRRLQRHVTIGLRGEIETHCPLIAPEWFDKADRIVFRPILSTM
jgi:hypothetical protein